MEITETNVSKKILDSAYKCISNEGYARASLRDIAEDAGVALSQLNYYYNNKEGLFQEVVKKLSDDFAQKTERILQQGNSDREKLNNLINYYRSLLHERPDLMRLLFDLLSMSMWNTTFKSLLSSLFERVSGMIRESIVENSELKTRHVGFSDEMLSKFITGTIFGTSMQYILNPSDHALLESLNCIHLSL